MCRTTLSIAPFIIIVFIVGSICIGMLSIYDPSQREAERVCSAEWGDFEHRVLVIETRLTVNRRTCQVKINGRWVNASAVKIGVE